MPSAKRRDDPESLPRQTDQTSGPAKKSLRIARQPIARLTFAAWRTGDGADS